MAEPHAIVEPVLTVVLCEAREATAAERAVEQELTDSLSRRDEINFAVLPHLYDLSPDGAAGQYLRDVRGDLVVLGRMYPRAAFWTLYAYGIVGHMGDTLPAADAAATRTIWCLDPRGHDDAQRLLDEIDRICRVGQTCRVGQAERSPTISPHRVTEPTAPRWYPVIDFSRCVNCLECLNFCLFGVFGLDEEGRIIVEQPDACRDGCPACSRICPAAAIIFPEYPDPAIAGGPAGASAGAALAKDELDRLVDELDDSSP